MLDHASALRQRLLDHFCHARECIAVLNELASMHVGEPARLINDEKCRDKAYARGTLPAAFFVEKGGVVHAVLFGRAFDTITLGVARDAYDPQTAGPVASLQRFDRWNGRHARTSGRGPRFDDDDVAAERREAQCSAVGPAFCRQYRKVRNASRLELTAIVSRCSRRSTQQRKCHDHGYSNNDEPDPEPDNH